MSTNSTDIPVKRNRILENKLIAIARKIDIAIEEARQLKIEKAKQEIELQDHGERQRNEMDELTQLKQQRSQNS